ncbi:MAG: hypothetical protein ACRDU9_04930 [Acidimicrobiia bacterium]
MTFARTLRWGWTRLALRIVTGVQALLVATQAALAGQFLTGNNAARAFHRELGTEVITWMAFVSLLLAVLSWRPGRYQAWPIVLTGLGLAAVILQLGYGFDGRLDIHIPLGLGIFALYLIVLVGFRRETTN